MKKIILTISTLIGCSAFGYSQGITDAYKYSQTSILGTARFAGMAGAMGSMGNDVSAIKVNPAGIGLYRNANEMVMTLDLTSNNNETSTQSDIVKEKKNSVKFNNMAYTASINLWNDDVPFINVGFSYSRAFNYDNNYTMQGYDGGSSISWLMADRANEYNPSPKDLLLSSTGNNANIWGSQSWLAILGYNSGMISSNNENEWSPSSNYFDNPDFKYLGVREKGGINNYNFNFGTEIDRKLDLGISFTVTDLSYHLYALYGEDFSTGGGNNEGYFDMSNYLKTNGEGYQFSLGAIYKPLETLNLGVAYHSPTWYNMTDYAYVNFLGNFEGAGGHGFDLDSYGGVDAQTDYKLRTADKWVFSASTIIRQNNRNFATISADYELTNYNRMNLDGRGSNYTNYSVDNSELRNYFRGASTLRIGTEIAFTPQFFGRLGYSWQQSGMKDIVNDKLHPVYTAGTTTSFIVPKDTNYFTWGAGYRDKGGFFADVAFIYKNQKAKLYSTSIADPVELKNNTYQGLLTLGYRFASF